MAVHQVQMTTPVTLFPACSSQGEMQVANEGLPAFASTTFGLVSLSAGKATHPDRPPQKASPLENGIPSPSSRDLSSTSSPIQSSLGLLPGRSRYSVLA